MFKRELQYIRLGKPLEALVNPGEIRRQFANLVRIKSLNGDPPAIMSAMAVEGAPAHPNPNLAINESARFCDHVIVEDEVTDQLDSGTWGGRKYSIGY